MKQTFDLTAFIDHSCEIKEQDESILDHFESEAERVASIIAEVESLQHLLIANGYTLASSKIEVAMTEMEMEQQFFADQIQQLRTRH